MKVCLTYCSVTHKRGAIINDDELVCVANVAKYFIFIYCMYVRAYCYATDPITTIL